MNQQEVSTKMKKYYIGLATIGVFALAVLILTLVQGASTKQDRVTNEKASDIAKELNLYISKNRKIPESLSEAGIKDAPSTITYNKDSETEYTFCITYKQSNGGVSTPDLLSGSAVREGASIDDDYVDDYRSTYKPSTLYISYDYKKGENCQTIKPYLYTRSTIQPSTRNSTPVTANSDAQAKARDSERKTDINSMYAKLEEYYNENNGYPQTFTSSTLTGISAASLIDPNGRTITMAPAVATKTAAKAAPAPTTTANYQYIPSGCSASACTGYIIRSYIEVPAASTPNPYTKESLN